MEDFVTVSVRIKPSTNTNEEVLNKCLEVINEDPAVLLVLDKSQTYHFDNIFTNNENQEDIYDDTVRDLVDKVKNGYNCTVFAYGQTGTGKTYTIGTNPDVFKEEDAGLITRTLKDFLQCKSPYIETELAISFIEIYNEKVFDLLTPNAQVPLLIKGFSVQGATKIKINSIFDALQHLKNGSSRRHTGETRQNSNSSRSHAIFTIHCTSRDCERETMAKLNLVDLAGSESVKKTGNQGSSFHEGININKGLLSLGQVMTALSHDSSHIPYRQSVITTILKDSLNKRNFISLIACVSSKVEDLGVTLQTLDFANRVKKMRNKPQINEIITQYKKDNPGSFPNSISRIQTPLKRSLFEQSSFETPFKKPKNTLPMIRDSTVSVNNSTMDISPLFSSSMRSVVSETPINFSPMVKKIMSGLQNTMISAIEDTIERSLRKRGHWLYQENKENLQTPRFCRRSLARSEQIEIDDSNNTIIVTSSPTKELPAADLSELEVDNHKLLNDKEKLDNDFVFKVPALKMRPKKASNTSERRGSMQVGRRSSVRLQMKKTNNVDSELERSNVIIPTRHSIRLQLKKVDSPAQEEEEEQVPRKRLTKKFSSCDNCGKKKATKSPKEDPITARTKKVLDILNKGTIKELEKLHTVGVKTAEKIKMFRELNGGIKSIADLAEMPSFSKVKFEKFLAENFLKHSK